MPTEKTNNYYFHAIDPNDLLPKVGLVTVHRKWQVANRKSKIENKLSPPLKVAIVEDSREIREGLVFLISGSPGLECVLACATAEQALKDIPVKKPEVVLMDIGLPGMSGIECIGHLKTKLPSTQIMMLTVFEDHDRIFQSLASGASGYLLKNTPPAKLIEAIRDLHRGGSPMSNQIARRVVEAFQKPTPSHETLETLSRREREILEHLAQGFLYKEIADKLSISIETVRTHIRNIYDKLHVRTRTEAILKVFPRYAVER